MPTAIQILVEGQVLPAELNDSETAKALLGRLPLRIRMSRWGDEYYGSIGEPLEVAPAADAREEMAVGELAYWIPGNALCIFFGPTPASEGEEPRAASAVNPLGMVTGRAEVLALKELGATVTAEVAAAG